jgi:hypothetical protein
VQDVQGTYLGKYLQQYPFRSSSDTSCTALAAHDTRYPAPKLKLPTNGRLLYPLESLGTLPRYHNVMAIHRSLNTDVAT